MFHLVMDLISVSLVFLMTTPLFLFAWTKNVVYLYVLLGVIFVMVSTQVLKQVLSLISDHPIFYRPAGARFCSTWNDVCDPKAPAFPSGHMSVVTFLLATLVLIMLPRNLLAWSFALVYIILMATSRYMKECHNMPQIVGGIAYGLLCTWMFFKLTKIRQPFNFINLQ